ncbi:hypothetical protein FE257_004164 [Aspergillus nanangensis]|uniref:U4/U6.U5 small nuclear ribonucleoprotein 27kDa protein domain-containing protein n=1 Tax=Aspergillus nanangensis TaxID=2582783 RepID=A0AAD4CRE5_ASPNN|nr:hypothetical protein FE257_004164 [Aspergillus nanangensis]
MAEPPAKRARRVDSSSMWDQNDQNTRSPEPQSDLDRNPHRVPYSKDDGRRDVPRDDRRYRSRSRERRDRRRYPSKGDRHRDRSRSPIQNGSRKRSRTPPRGSRVDRRNDRRDMRPQGNGTADSRLPSQAKDEMDVDVDADSDIDEDDVDALMRRSMGFSKFRSTKNTKVPGNDIYGVRKEKKTEYRQYMNRQGGFNRPLSPG